MKRILGALTLAAGLAASPALAADKEPIRVGTALDFTAVYTFVSAEYSQGQRDYIALVNAQGGIDGHPVQIDVVDTGNQPQRGIEAYERFKAEGVVLMDFLSTPVSRAIVPRALAEGQNVITLFHGRSDAIDGEVFKTIFPLTPNYWGQATAIVKYIEEKEAGNLKGKKIALVGIDSPFGREPIPVFQTLAEKLGYEFLSYPYPSPGTEQSAVWTDVRRARPDWVVIWGAGGGQTVSLGTALRNGIPMDRLISVIWLSETDMNIVGAEAAKGVQRFEGVASGRQVEILKEIQGHVIDKGLGSGPNETVGGSYYNIGVASMAIFAEGARLALAAEGAPLTADKLRRGLEMVKDYDAKGLLPPITINATDHGGGGRGRIAAWDGVQWLPQTDWYNAYTDIVWELVGKSAEEFKTTGK